MLLRRLSTNALRTRLLSTNAFRTRPLSTASSPGRGALTYYSAWFCPFAHRATLALEHHAGAVPYEWDEALGWEERPPTGEENFAAEERQNWYYHWKSPGLLAANPLGMVPTLHDAATGRTVTESIVCIQFVDELALANGSTSPSLLPADPFERARARVAADAVNRQVCSAYYQVLVRPELDQRKAAFEQILEGLRTFTRERKGLFWNGDEGLGLVDCTLLPYAYRLYVLEHYRGAEFAVPRDGEDGLWQAYHAWLDACVAMPHVASTLPGKERYLQHVKKYAEGRARSKVGNAVRRGVAAHDYSDTLDGDEADGKKAASS